jgi:hypothetical protein
MDIEKALTIIKNASSQYRGTLEDHNQIQQALIFIEQELSNKTKVKKDESVQKER